MLTLHLIVKFWSQHPALLYGTSLLLGIYGSLYGSFHLFLPLLALWSPFLALAYRSSPHSRFPLMLSLTSFLAAWTHMTTHYTFPFLPEQGLEGTAHVSIHSLIKQASPFGMRWIYDCQLHSFFPTHWAAHSVASHVRCLVGIPLSDDLVRPSADRDYVIKGRLIQTTEGQYILKISPFHPWSAVQDSWSWAELRYGWKKQVKTWIHSHFSHPLSATFLAALITGELDDRWMRQEFARFGLQHILAISGFHFAILSAFLSFLMRLFLPRKISAMALLLGMGSYCFFLGFSASVLRAWLMGSLTVAGHLLEKRAAALNSLGIALMGVLAIDPLLSQTLGFQLSFTTTLAILLIYGPADHLLKQILVKRPLKEVIEMNNWNQHGYYLLALFRQALALTLAINVFALPLTLYYFNQFPLMSLLYNLFFPLLITGSLGLLIVGALLSPIPLLGTSVHSLNNFYTERVLQLTYQMPKSADTYLSLETFPTGWLILYLSITCLTCMALKCHLEGKEDKSAFEFI